MDCRRFTVTADDAGRGLSEVVSDRLGRPAPEIDARIRDGGVYVNRRRVRDPALALEAGARLEVWLAEGGRDATSETAPFPAERVLEEAPSFVVVDKPAGIPAQPTRRSVAIGLPARVRATLGGPPLEVVHRLDLGTTGVTILARDDDAARALAEAFRSRQVEKTYLALLAGQPADGSGQHDGRLGPDRARKGRQRVLPKGGKSASTAWEVLGTGAHPALPSGVSLVLARPLTGRTHQIRVHLADLGCPLLGDGLYGGPTLLTGDDGERLELGRPMLHAWRLSVPHPLTGARLDFEAPIPEDFAALANVFGLSLPG